MYRRRFRESRSSVFLFLKSSREILSALKQCGVTRELELGSYIHRSCREENSDVFLSNTVLQMYVKCGELRLARETFEGMSFKNVVSWTCIIMGHVDKGESLQALEMFDRIDCAPDILTYVAIVKACTKGKTHSEKLALLERGVEVHSQIIRLQLESNVILASALVEMYSRCGDMPRARDLFHQMNVKNVYTWTSLIMGYVENGEIYVALELFKSMDLEPDHVTYIAILKACASLASKEALETGMSIHERLRKRGFESKTPVANTLIDMYSKHGRVSLAKDVFDRMPRRDVVSWNCLILAYAVNVQSFKALELFRRMDIKPDHITYVGVLKACGALAGDKSLTGKTRALDDCVLVHKLINEQSIESRVVVENTLLDTYIKCGSISLAKTTFDTMVYKDVVSWNCLITGYAEEGETETALELLECMDCEPDRLTYVAALKACGSSTWKEPGRRMHGAVCRLGLEEVDTVATSLVNFYGKCGCMEAALEVFNGMHTPSVASWNALLTGYSSTGDSSQVLRLVRRMEEGGVQKDEITLVAVLTACSHAGMVEEGERWFEAMRREGISPTVQHYTCMVDMLGRANRVEEAVRLVKEMPLEANEVTWMSMLVSSRKWNNVNVGKAAFQALCESSNQSVNRSAAYVLMAHTF